ncbi:MAG: hypothetical protein QOJ80_6077 [Mycobacterium sp.]|nr:hypothetical protein [Mycobacterium sp.]
MSLLRVVVGVVSATALVACSGAPGGTAASASSTPAPSAAPSVSNVQVPAVPGVELPAGQIPWNRVGPGWILATWSPTPSLAAGQRPPAGQPPVAPVTLYLLDPAGPRYAITTLPLLPPTGPGDLGHTPFLADWSGDGRRALFEDYGPDSPGHTAVTEVDLATGASHGITTHGQGYGGAYSRPTGQSIIMSTFNGFGHGWTLERVDLSGDRQLTFPTGRLGAAGNYNGDYLESPDGTQLVLGTDHGLVMMASDGVLGRRLPVLGPLTDCHPVRWWSATIILTRCDGGTSSSASQLLQVPLSGGPASAITAVNSGQDDSGFGNDVGDMDAWRLSSGTFLASMAGCGAGFLSRLTPDMHTTAVTVPGIVDSGHVSVAGATGDKLLLSARMGCGPGISILTYDPAAGTSTVLLGPPVDGGSVENAILYRTGCPP